MFENHYLMNEKLYLEYVSKALYKKIIRLGVVLFILGVVLYYFNYSNDLRYSMLALIFVGLYTIVFVPVLYAKKLVEYSKKLNNGKIETTIVKFNEKIEMDEGLCHLEFDYSQIHDIMETKNFIVLRLTEYSSILVFKDGFINSNKEDFMKFIKEKTNLTGV